MSEDRQRLARIKHNLEQRAQIFHIIRTFFNARDFLEVDTPIRSPAIAPERYISPVVSEGCFLATSPELYMKRMLAAGYSRIYQISHCFRKGERGRQHNPEFALLEWYRAGANYPKLIADTEELVVTIARRLKASTTISYRGQSINLAPPWQRVTVQEAFSHAAGWDPVTSPDPPRFDIDLIDKVLPSFEFRPTALIDYPVDMASLARLKPGNPQVAERAEVFIGGLELANAYSELNNRTEQERRFIDEMEQIERERGLKMPLPSRFLESISFLPECAGIALGVDRLVMLFCDADSIDDVMPFTTDTA